MKPQKFTEQLSTIYGLAVRLSKAVDADALLILLEGPTDWEQLKKLAGREKILIAADVREQVEGAVDVGLSTVVLDMADSPVYDKLTQALLQSVADEILAPGALVIAIYSGFEASKIDSISCIRLDDFRRQLT